MGPPYCPKTSQCSVHGCRLYYDRPSCAAHGTDASEFTQLPTVPKPAIIGTARIIYRPTEQGLWNGTVSVRIGYVRSSVCLAAANSLLQVCGPDRGQEISIDCVDVASLRKHQCPIQRVMFSSLAVVDPRVGRTMDVLSPFISVLCYFSLTIPEGLVVSYQHWTSACCHTANICWSLILFLKK